MQAPARNRRLYFADDFPATSAPKPQRGRPMLIARILRLALVALAGGVLGVAALLVANTPAGWPPALLLALLLVPVGFAVVLGIEFLAGGLLGDRHWRGLGPAWLGEIVASMRTFLLAIPLAGHRGLRTEAGTGTSSRLPVVLVHGYFCNHAVWRPFARHLGRAGHRVEAIDLEPAFGSIDAYASTIAAAVASAGADGRPVVLVGHSMGGLAIRAYLRQAGPAAIAGVVTLGTPHRGTRAAALGRTLNTRQMRRDSAWIAALEAHERAATMPPCGVILTRNDNIVYPQADQVLPGARVLPLEGIGHLGLAYHPAAWRLVDEEIRRFEGMLADPAAESREMGAARVDDGASRFA